MRRTKGSGSVYQQANGLWTCVIELPEDPKTGKRRRKVIRRRSRSECVQAFIAEREKLVNGGGIQIRGHSPVLKDWLDTWLQNVKASEVKPRVLESYRSECRNISDSIGYVHLPDITPAVVRRMIAGIESHASAKTALNCYRRLSAALDEAVTEGIIDTNPCKSIKAPRVTPNPTIILPPDGPEKLIRAAMLLPGEDGIMWSLMWRVAFETGMRQGERFALTASSLCISQGVTAISVTHELQRFKIGTVPPRWLKARNIEGGTWLVPPKSQHGVRIVPVSQGLWNALRKYAAHHCARTTDLIFTRDGHPLTNPVERRAWMQCLQDAGLPQVTIRSARHWYATRIALEGASQDERTALMGHASISTTAGYTHWTPQALSRIASLAALPIEDEAV